MLEKYKKTLSIKGEIYLRLKVFPGANLTELKEVRIDDIDDNKVETLIVNIKAQAEKNKANQELIKFLSKEFGVLKENIFLISGASSRIKLLKVKI